MISRRLVNLLSWLLTATLFLAGAVLLRLSWGAIDLPGVAAEIETQLNEKMGGWRMEVGGASVAFDAPSGQIALVLDAVALSDEIGSEIAAAPSAVVAFDLDAAMRGELRIEEIDLRGVAVVARRSATGEVTFALETSDAGASAPSGTPQGAELDAPPDASAPALVEASGDASSLLFDILAGEKEPPAALARLNSVTVRDSQVTLVDAASGLSWRLADGELSLSRDDVAYTLTIAGGLSVQDAAPPLPVVLDATLRRGETRAEVRIETPGAPLADVIAQYPALSPLAPIGGDLVADASFRLDLGDGAISTIHGDVRLRDGVLRIDEREASPIDELRMKLFVDPAADSLELREIAVRTPDLWLRGEMGVQLLRDSEGAVEQISAQLKLGDPDAAEAPPAVVVVSPDYFVEPVRIGYAAADIAYRVGDASVTVRGMELSVNEIPLAAGSGRFAFKETLADTEIALEAWCGRFADRETARCSGFEISDIVDLWPVGVAPLGRAWIAETISEGRIAEGRFVYSGRLSAPEADLGEDACADMTLAEAPGPEQRLALTAVIEDATTLYLDGSPPITGAGGRLCVTLQRLDVAVSSGEVAPPGRAPISLAGSDVSILSFEGERLPGVVRLQAGGSIGGLLALLDAPPLELLSSYGRDLSGLEGAFEARAELAFPLLRELPVEEVSVTVAATLSDVALEAAELDGAFTSRRLELEATTDGARLRGDGVYDGRRVSLDIREAFSEAGGESQARTRFSITARDLEEAGVNATFLQSGALVVTLDLSLALEDAPIVVRVNATDAALALPTLGWSKAAGVEATARARLVPRGSGWRIEALRGAFGDLAFEGEATFGAEGEIIELRFSDVTIGSGTQFALWTEARESGVLTYVARGPRFDLSNVGGGEETNEPRARLNFDFAFEEARVSGGRVVQDLAIAGGQFEDGVVIAEGRATAGSAELTLKLRRDEATGAQGFVLSTDEASAALRALDLYRGSRGGVMALSGVARGGVVDGELRAQNIVLEDAPILAELLSVATGFGLFDQFGSGGTSFTRVSVPFRLTDEKMVMRDGVAAGPSLGVSFSGEIDRRAQTVDIAGTLSPANIVNMVVSEVPILGDILGDGIIAIAFTVRGPIDDPRASANPLTALTPGPFREILTGDDFDLESRRDGRREDSFDR